MKRFNCTLADKRGAFGECMEVHSTGRYVLFSDVEKLQRRMQELLEKSHCTGVAIDRAISTGSVLADHPLKSRLELLANHHRREIELEGLLREVLWLECRDGLSERIEAALDGKSPQPEVTLTETIRTAPERIWLQVGDHSHYHSEPFPSDTSEVSWCADSVVGCEVPYVRADLACQVPVHDEIQGWLPIETAPHDGRKALVYRPLAESSGDERIAVKRLTGGRSNSCWDKTVPPGETPCNPTDGACHVTHWMPLPDEPAQQGGEPCDFASPSSSKA